MDTGVEFPENQDHLHLKLKHEQMNKAPKPEE